MNCSAVTFVTVVLIVVGTPDVACLVCAKSAVESVVCIAILVSEKFPFLTAGSVVC